MNNLLEHVNMMKEYVQKFKAKVIFHTFFEQFIYSSSGIKKKIEAKGKRNDCKDLLKWTKSVANHVYFCAATCGGDGDLFSAKWLSILEHVVDEHDKFDGVYPKCCHPPIDQPREWLRRGEYRRLSSNTNLSYLNSCFLLMVDMFYYHDIFTN